MKNIKTVIIDCIIEKVEAQIKSAERGRLSAIEEAKAHKGAMESRYDTFKEEAQYLAGGYNARSLEREKMLSALKSVKDCLPVIVRGSDYAIVDVKNLDDELITKYFLLPAGGGDIYEVEGEKITVINVGAPLARAFIGAVAGDELEVKIQETIKRFTVVSVI